MSIDETWLRERLDDLRASVFFLTRLHFGAPVPIDGAAVARAAWAFPIAGALVGLIGAVVYLIAHRIGLAAWLSAVLSIAATMAVTGCLHEDGLADTTDGFGGGKTRQQKLDIMRDSRIGTFGVCALLIAVLLRAGALATIVDPHAVALTLIATHGAARAMLPVFMMLVPPARRDGLSFAAGQPRRESVAAAAALGALLLLLCLGIKLAIIAVVLLALAAGFMAWLSVVEIEGQTGDVLGAVEQVSEIVIMLVVVHAVPGFIGPLKS